MGKRKSIGTYPPDWNKIALKVKQDAEWKCIRCRHTHDPQAGYCLTVHHLDLDPSNCEWWNIPALCQRCHLHIQGKVVLEQKYFLEHSEWFKPYVAGYYASINGHPTDRKYVMNNMEMLLDYGR